MPAVLTHKAVFLLARDRLAEIRDGLKAKAASSGVTTPVETRVLQLATEAHRILSQQPHPNATLPGAAFGRPLGQDVSMLGVLGAMGPDITGFSAALAPGQAWVFDTIHKGYPDGNREAVIARTSDLAFAIWRRASAAVTAAVTDLTQQQQQLDRVRAYVLGHLCHHAGDILSHPYINDLQWHLGTKAFDKLDHQDGEVSHDALVAQKIFLRKSTHDGQGWDAWWPTSEDLPPGFLDAYKEALEDVYKSRSSPRTGWEEFKQHFTTLEAPPLDTAFMRDGYSMFRSILNVGYGWGGWSWFGFTTMLWLPVMTFPLLGIALKHSRQFYLGAEADSEGDTGTFEMLALPLTLGSFVTLIYGIWLTTLTTHGVTARMVLELVGTSVNTVLGVVVLATSHLRKDQFSLEARYPLLIVLPLGLMVLNLILGIVDVSRDGYKRRSGISFIYALPTALMLLTALITWLIYKIAIAASSDNKVSPGAYAVITVLWFLVAAIPWFVLPFTTLRNIVVPEYPRQDSEPPHFVRLFDEATVYAGRADNKPAGAVERYFPSGRRKLIQLWWEGDGDLFIRVDRFRLAIAFDDSGAINQEVVSPIAPMNAADYIKFLERTVKGPDNSTGKLKGTLVFPGEDYVLPPGATFADFGDSESKMADHNTEAAKFKKLGKTQDPDGFILYHAPQFANTVFFGSTGGVVNNFGNNDNAIRAIEATNGYTYVYDAVQQNKDALMSYAADLGALFCLGAVTHISTLNPAPEPVYQVFRNWNLDRRRVNEWRMLVAGGAVSEKNGAPTHADEAMLQPPSADTWRSAMDTAPAEVVAEAEKTALDMGFIPLLREWYDMTHRPSVNPTTEERFNPNNPTNRAMTRAMAWLLDMPQPV